MIIKETTLKLTVNKKAFEITGTKEKMYELRRKSKWIESRLFDKEGNHRAYFFVELRNGYNKNSPLKKFGFGGFTEIIEDKTKTYSNGLTFELKKGDYFISLIPLN